MQSKTLDFQPGFRVVFGNARAQAAAMTIAPGEREGDAENRHAQADQWLYVVEGSGTALVEDTPHALRPGVLLLIERGERHEVRNDGKHPLKTINWYVPPEY
ncbi:MAG TPA: cupin domain-containing protein [Rhodanobacteraceae bacterium]|nr:cupin domain-containing protein [Rhodanobacteraceae bacterium]